MGTILKNQLARCAIVTLTLLFWGSWVTLMSSSLRPLFLTSPDPGFLQSCNTTKSQLLKEDQLSTFRSQFTNVVEKEVQFNNWNMGCLDLQFLVPYFRSILYRQAWDNGRGRQVIFDVGANNGDDAETSLKMFDGIAGMCKSFGSPIKLISIEPSPTVFCEFKNVVPENKRLLALNIALSDATGYLEFRDPGNEGGHLVGGNFHDLERMNSTEIQRLSQCQVSNSTVKAEKRVSIVPTYTMDLLWDSLLSLGQVGIGDGIFVLKIDTEGHDKNVIFGSKNLLLEKRISFIIFETMKNAFVKSIAEFVDPLGYLCFLITRKQLIPVDAKTWWYSHMDNFTSSWWGNGVCGIRDSESMKMLWRMYHSDDPVLMSSYEMIFLE
eukprot:CAMPEP_0113469464 /NCGR_PEP_ID=MMETSP0014_2-20120614/15914_1 /TAXON_ID=2857 /ORGANISM="Nitzschia sp." /LENGTH=379 /DNA_ID=CAMNT_0000361945 /DNA_START=84 /DNA_END=1223 /DNA_ORIENTATION=- /assembly_acc=CAM_ASM_000159